MSTRVRVVSTLAIIVTIINVGIVFTVLNQPKHAVAAVSGYKLTPILMIPSDKTAKPEYQNSINQAMVDIQKWYATQIGSTFKYDPVITVTSSHPDSYFRCTTGSCATAGGVGTDYNLVNDDLDSLVSSRTAQADRIIFLVGAGPLAIGGGSLDSSRFAILGDTNLDGISGLTSPAAINQQIGALAHEIGHTFDLPHPESDLAEYNNLMGFGWYYYPNVVINDTNAVSEENYIKKSPFLLKQSVPGCTQFTGSHLSITQDTVLCPGVFRVSGSATGVISIDANNVTLDGSNASFLGSDTTSGKYGLIITGRTGVTVKNIRFSGYFYGIKAENSSSISIQDIVSNYNSKSDGTFLSINIVFPGMGGGVVFNNVTNSIVKNNVLINQNTGIHLYNSNGNTIENNQASFNKTWGVALYGSSNNNVLQNDTQHVNRCADGGCDSAGILLVHSSHSNLIEGNNMNYSGDGFFIGNEAGLPSNNNIIRNNIANYSPANGFEATFSTGNVFDSNEANGNNYGFWLGFSYNNTVTNNIVKNNRASGIEQENGRYTTISNNLFQNNVNGVYLRNNPSNSLVPSFPGSEVSTNYTITNNNFLANTRGLAMQNVQTSTVTNNTFTSNGKNLEYGDATLPVSGVTTVDNNFICGSGSSSLTNLLLNKTSTSNVANSFPERANDGDTTGGLGIPYDFSHSWVPGTTVIGNWWKADMGSIQTMNSVVVYSYINNYGDIPHIFHIETSTTGAFSGEQTTVATEPDWWTPNSPRYKIYTFSPISARYVRFVIDVDGQSWGQVQEIEVYNDPNILSDYTPNSFCNYNFYDNLPAGSTTNLQNNYWEYAPKGSLAETIYDHSDNPGVGTADYSSPLGSRATTTSDILDPSLTINSPSSGATLSGSLTTSVTATDNVRVRSVDYYVDDIYLGNSFISPFSLTFNTVRIADGAHTFKTVTTDNANNVRTTTTPVIFSNNFVLDLTAPSVPGGLVATGVTSNSVPLSWTAATDNVGVTDYLVKRDGSLIAQVSTTSYTDNNLTSGASYNYNVAAADAADNISADSSDLLVTTEGPPPAVTSPAMDPNPTAAPGNGNSTYSWNHTVGYGSNRLLLVGVSIRSAGTTSVSSVVFGSQTLSFVGGSGTNVRTELWKLVAPVSGTNTITVNLTAGVWGSTAGGSSWYGVDQTNPLGIYTGRVGSSTAPSVSVSTSATDKVVDVMSIPNGVSDSVLASAGQSEIWNQYSVGDTKGASSYKIGSSGTTTMSWTTKPESWSISAVPLKLFVNSKIGDINKDGKVNSADLAILVTTWGSTTDLRADLNADGRVASGDLAIVISRWGS